MYFSQAVLFFDYPFQSVILHLLISVCIQFHNLFFVDLLVDFPEDYYKTRDLLLFYYTFC